jgi:gamma-glutamylcyclotransferase (GGCT)/AIG2-like uncharacterized protein YtfP
MNRVLRLDAEFVGKGAVRGQLFSLGAYPGLMPSDNAADWVKGEVYEIAPRAFEDTLATLDQYEGITASEPEPHEYRREVVKVRLANGETTAWAYVLNRPPQGPRIPSGDFLEWQHSRGA